MQHVEEIIEQVASTLGDAAQSDVVVGTPLEVGPVTVVPISRISVGFGGGGGEGKGRGPGDRKKAAKSTGRGTGRGSASGGAALVRPVAVVVLREEGVEVLPVPERPTKLGRLIDQIPDLIDRFQKS